MQQNRQEDQHQLQSQCRNSSQVLSRKLEEYGC